MLLLSLRLIPAGIDRKLHNLFRHSTKVVQHRRSAVLYEEAMAEFAATAGRAPNRGQFLAQESTLCSVKAHVPRAARCSALAAQAGLLLGRCYLLSVGSRRRGSSALRPVL
jgi:hypothetical protein